MYDECDSWLNMKDPFTQGTITVIGQAVLANNAAVLPLLINYGGSPHHMRFGVKICFWARIMVRFSYTSWPRGLPTSTRSVKHRCT